MFRIDDGSPAPLGATFDGRGVNFALFSANATGVELCLFDPKGSREIERVRAAAPHRPGLACLCRWARPRAALRLPRARALRPAPRPPLQPAQAPDRPLRTPALRSHALARRAVRLPHRRRSAATHPGPARQRADACRNASSRIRRIDWGDDRPPRRPAPDTHRLRGACEGADRAPSRGARRRCAAPMTRSATRR